MADTAQPKHDLFSLFELLQLMRSQPNGSKDWINRSLRFLKQPNRSITSGKLIIHPKTPPVWRCF